jgi:uncharacterized protein with von Willebrand factor type A (vWA) domain
MTSGTAAADELTGTLVGFARVLRAAGVPATPDRLHTTVAAVGHLDIDSAAATLGAVLKYREDAERVRARLESLLAS